MGEVKKFFEILNSVRRSDCHFDYCNQVLVKLKNLSSYTIVTLTY